MCAEKGHARWAGGGRGLDDVPPLISQQPGRGLLLSSNKYISGSWSVSYGQNVHGRRRDVVILGILSGDLVTAPPTPAPPHHRERVAQFQLAQSGPVP